jgi:membrane-associated phospholipid phosphatase
LDRPWIPRPTGGWAKWEDPERLSQRRERAAEPEALRLEVVPVGSRTFHPVDPAIDSGSVFRNYPLTTRIALWVTAGAVLLLVLLLIRPTRDAIHGVDEAMFRFVGRVRTPPLMWIGYLFNVLGGAYVTVPVRAALAVWLTVKRRWWFLATFALAQVTSELLNTYLKKAYHRARPPGSLVSTSGGSFPSGHAVAASVIALVLVMLLLPPGPRRRHWWIGAILFTLVMATTRIYLRAHWLSDAIGGVLIGSACALDSALVIQAVRDHRERRALTTARAAPPEVAEEMPESGPLEADVEGEPG